MSYTPLHANPTTISTSAQQPDHFNIASRNMRALYGWGRWKSPPLENTQPYTTVSLDQARRKEAEECETSTKASCRNFELCSFTAKNLNARLIPGVKTSQPKIIYNGLNFHLSSSFCGDLLCFVFF